ncbi:cell wall protein [Streptomyces mayteni]
MSAAAGIVPPTPASVDDQVLAGKTLAVDVLDVRLVRGAAQEVKATASRQAQPRVWLRSVSWLVGAGLHPQAGERTLKVAQDLARRMDYTLGTVLYDLEGTAARLGVSVATVKRHVAVLRELGALAWVRHGSKANLHLPGRRYTATATIYGAVIPPVFDAAMGHRLSGGGYEARVVGVTEAGRARAVAAARQAAAAAGNAADGAVKNRRPGGSSAGRAPHSRGQYPVGQKVEVGGGLKDTSRERASRSSTSTSPTKTSSKAARRRRSPLQVAMDIAIARRVRPLVAWTQTERLRRLAFALRPLIDEGMGVQEIVAELHAWYLDWRPSRPAAYITAQLKDRTTTRAARAAAVSPEDSPAWQAYLAQRQAAQVMAQLEAAAATMRAAAARTDEDRRQARAAARYAPWKLLDHLEEHGEDDTFDLYGWRMTAWAQGLAASPHVR